jgi:hypothetical protein
VKSGSWKLEAGKSKMENGKVKSGSWKLEAGKSKMKNYNHMSITEALQTELILKIQDLKDIHALEALLYLLKNFENENIQKLSYEELLIMSKSNEV